MTEAYPLQWPINWPRTESGKRRHPAFVTSWESAQRGIVDEVRRLGGKGVIISSNVPLRKTNGLPYSNNRKIDDPGVAVYFQYKGREVCIPCDKWMLPMENMRAIQKSIDALRGLDRWGAKQMVDAAFQGFAALPYLPERKEVVEYFKDLSSIEAVKARYKELVKAIHPDAQGSSEMFIVVQGQYEAKLKELGGA